MKLKMFLFFVTYFILQLGFCLTAFPETVYANKLFYLGAYFIFSVSMFGVTIELYYIAKYIIKNAKLELELSTVHEQQRLKDEQMNLLTEQQYHAQKQQQDMKEHLHLFDGGKLLASILLFR